MKPHVRIGEETLTEQDVKKLHYMFDLVEYLIQSDPHFRSMVIAHRTKNKLTHEDDTNE